MLKKNIAKTMAAATVLTAAAPMANVVFADVMDTTQAEEIKALKEKVYGVFNAKYTQNKALLNVVDDTVVGTPVFSEVTIEVRDAKNVPISGSEETATNYADFVKKFDKAFNNLSNGEKVMVSFESDAAARVLEKDTNLDEATIVDFKESKFSGIEHTGNSEGTGIDTTGDNFDKLNLGDVKYGELADGKSYAKLPIAGGKYITVYNDDVKLDLNKPKFKVVDGYYVDANGNSIKKFNLEKDCENATIVDELVALGGVVEGYYEDTTVPLEDTDKIEGTYAIVKKADAATKEDLTVGDIYEASTGRLTKKGNEFVKAIYNMIADDMNGNKEDNLRGRLTTINKAGEVVDTLTTYDLVSTRTSVEETFNTWVDELTTYLEGKEVEKVKVVFETTKNEQVVNPAPEWTPVYEGTITEGRNEKFANIAAGFAGLNKMPIAAGMNRYETAVETSKKGWNSGSDNVVLVSGASDKLVDGLTATPLAASLDAPVLLTKAGELPEETIKEIKRLEATTITVVGGKNSVSDEVITKLRKTYGLKVNRLGGDSRYETSMAVANEIAKDDTQTTGQFDKLFVVGGKGEADALSASAIAGTLESVVGNKEVAPILLTPAGELDKDVKHFINKNINDNNEETDVYIVGGANSVSSKVQNELVNIKAINNTDNTIEVKRLSGTGRQETNAAVIKEFATDLSDGVVVAKSDNKGMVDALAAGALAARTNSHIVLATNELVDSQEDALKLTNDGETVVDTKAQVGYGIGESVIKFVNSIFKR